jgi:tripartite-type tricarboxylate transporter receptor subunit TctC
MPSVASLMRMGLVALAAVLVTASASAQTYPNKVIKIIVPFAVGGQPDTVARLMAQHLQATLGTTIIDNRPGNSTIIGSKFAAGSDPDGYTLLFGSTTSLAIVPAMTSNAGYDAVTSFKPIAAISRSAMYLNVGPAVKARTVGELVAFAKANPGKIAFASPGYGTQPHLLGEMLKAAAGIDIVHVPYKGPANAITDLIAGQVQIYFETSPLVLPQAQSGRLKVLAAASARRVPQLPDVPTTAESGFPELRGGFWSGIVAPPRTPAAIVSVLNAAINAAMQADGVKGALLKLGAESRLGSPGDFRSFLAEESRKWTAIIKTAGLKID